MSETIANGLIGHWPLPNESGRDCRIEMPHSSELNLGAGDFSISLWLHTDALKDIGDLINKFDPDTRRGFTLGVVTSSGVTYTAKPNSRNIHFGIDGGTQPKWRDCGRPGNAINVQSLAVCGGNLYAGTLELGSNERGHLWRYTGGTAKNINPGGRVYQVQGLFRSFRTFAPVFATAVSSQPQWHWKAVVLSRSVTPQ